MIEPRLMGNRELLKEIREIESAIENDFVDVSLSTLKFRQDRLNELQHELERRTTLAPKPKTRTITYIEKDLMTGKVEAVKRYTIPDRE